MRSVAALAPMLVLAVGCGLEAATRDVERATTPTVGLDGVPRRSGWWYRDDGADLGTAWRTQVYGGDGWDFGQGPLGYGESYHTTTISYGPSATSKYVTTYFVTTIYLDNPSAATSMIGEAMYDDGFVAYLNGIEIGRASMPAGAITASTLAIGHETGNAYETFDWSAHTDALVAGINVIAVEVHQASRSSSDLTFDLALHLLGHEPPPPSDEQDIARGSEWRYWDRRDAPSTYDFWALPEYNDAVWASGAGPLGYGESYVATPISYGADPGDKTITAYFRRWFTVAAPTIDTRLLAEVMYDDGVVVHLNGHEIARLHMPPGFADHTTRSTGHETGNEYEVYDWSEASQWLVPGPNLLAVDVHQVSPTSSDLVFDLALRIEVPATCAIPGCGPATPPPPAADLNGVWVGPTAVWAVGDDGAIGRRTDGDDRWCWCAPDPGVSLDAVWGSGDDDVWIVGDRGRVLHHDGASLAAVDVGTTAALHDVWGDGAGDLVVVGDGGTVRRFDGATWIADDLGADQTLLCVWGASADDVWVGGTEPAPYPGNPYYDGSSAILYRRSAGGAGWSLEGKWTMYYGGADIGGIHGSGPDDVWAAGTLHPAGAASAHSQAVHRDATGWSRVDQPGDIYGNHYYSDVLALGADVWITARWGTTVHRDAAGWSQGDAVSAQMNAIDGRAGAIWAVGSQNRIIRWDGARWVRSR